MHAILPFADASGHSMSDRPAICRAGSWPAFLRYREKTGWHDPERTDAGERRGEVLLCILVILPLAGASGHSMSDRPAICRAGSWPAFLILIGAIFNRTNQGGPDICDVWLAKT